MIELKLPYPVSSNKYWRRSGRNMHRSDEAKNFIEEVKWIAKSKKAVQGVALTVIAERLGAE